MNDTRTAAGVGVAWIVHHTVTPSAAAAAARERHFLPFFYFNDRFLNSHAFFSFFLSCKVLFLRRFKFSFSFFFVVTIRLGNSQRIQRGEEEEERTNQSNGTISDAAASVAAVAFCFLLFPSRQSTAMSHWRCCTVRLHWYSTEYTHA